MTNTEILELFFSRAYENTLNNNILSDVDYAIPYDGILNYVCEIITVPYKEYLEYIEFHPDISPITSQNITQSSSFTACEREMVEMFLEDDNSGLLFDQIGARFTKYVRSDNVVAYRKYGENQVKTSSQLGLAFEYFKHWYLNCVGYIYNQLPADDQQSLLARNILRDPLYRKIMNALLHYDIDIIPYMSCLKSDETKYRRYDSVKTLLDICIREATKEHIPLHSILETKDNLLPNKKKKNNNSAISCYEDFNTMPLSVAEKELKGLDYYINKFKKLRCYTLQGKPAPYKAIMLLSVMNLIQKGIIKDTSVYPNKELKAEYKSIADSVEYDKSLFTPSFNNPFVHLMGDGFWHLIDKDGAKCIETPNIKTVSYALIDRELFDYMQDSSKSSLLRKTLFKKYLSNLDD